MYAPVAQLDRVADFESARRGFESLRAYQKAINLWAYLVQRFIVLLREILKFKSFHFIIRVYVYHTLFNIKVT